MLPRNSSRVDTIGNEAVENHPDSNCITVCSEFQSFMFWFDVSANTKDLPDLQPTNSVPFTVDILLETLNMWDGTTNIVTQSIWHQIPNVISGFCEASQSNINKILDDNIPINNRRALSQSLHSLSHSPSCDRNVKRRVDTLLPLIDGISDTNYLLVEKGFIESLKRRNQTLTDGINYIQTFETDLIDLSFFDLRK
ncbi:hypothetical protein BLNAU_20205 [Blattamonas nauphoetae]|uniref:Uncharacterized protein n=1 Tax=Blattamonas nauphoetae TaxID=2049346 RepID=A0ABQ9X1Q8_9EUKA|nr:hypothetical protein BLNAU_20205 [Blattamonas nauphoetae]